MTRVAGGLIAALFGLVPTLCLGQAATDAGGAPAAGAAGGIAIELNKLESADNSCRSYFVLKNNTGRGIKDLKIDVFLFDTDGVILNNIGFTFANVRSGKTKVGLFVLAETACEPIARMLVNDVPICTDDAGATIEGCADLVATSTRSSVVFEY